MIQNDADRAGRRVVGAVSRKLPRDTALPAFHVATFVKD
jgi:hypothetical protein